MANVFRAAYIIALPGFIDAYRAGTIFDGGSAAGIGLVPWVSDAKVTPIPAATVTLTQDSYVVEGHPKGIRAWDIVLSGSVQHPHLRSLMANADDSESESHKRLSTVSFLLTAALKTERRTVYFYGIDEGWHFEAVPQSMDFRRGNPNKTGMQYMIRLRAVRVIESPIFIGTYPLVVKTASPESFWSDLAAAYSTAKDFLANVRDGFYVGIERARSPFRIANNVMREAELLLEEIDNALVALKSLKNEPSALSIRAKRLAAKAGAVKREFLGESWGVAANGGSSDQYGSMSAFASLSAALEWTLEQQMTAIERLMNILSMKALATASVSGSLDRWWKVRSVDTMSSIAAAVYGDAGRAGELAEANGLKYPYISASAGDGVLTVGDKLRVPGGTGAVSGTLANQGDTSDEALFGIDLRLDADGDLYRVGADDDMDIALIGGMDNMMQAIDTKNLTMRGSNRYYRTFGTPVEIGSAATDTAFALFAASMTESFKADDRIVSVEALTLKDEGNGWEWEGLLTLASGIQLPATGVV